MIASKLMVGLPKCAIPLRIEYDERVHACYEPIRTAAATKGWKFITVRFPQVFIFGRKANMQWFQQMLHIVTHIKLALSLLLTPKTVNIFVREFITIPLLITVPLWWRHRKSVVFLNNHNFQFARRKWSHRVALTLLLKCGIRIAAVELSQRALIGMTVFGEDIIVPFPVALRTCKTRSRERCKLRIGVLTSFRKEQRADELINYLCKTCSDRSLNWELAVATHYPVHLDRVMTKIDVALPLESDEDYWNAICSFDVIVLFYNSTAYEHRTSGIIADAIACAVPVICPDYPIMNRQVNWPAKMGLVYRNLEELPSLIVAIAMWPVADIAEASKEHQRLRGQAAYGEILDSLRL